MYSEHWVGTPLAVIGLMATAAPIETKLDMQFTTRRHCLSLAVGGLLVAALSNIAHAQETPSDLEALVQEARENHPDAKAAHFRSGAAAQIPSQRGSLPDPVLVSSLQNLRTDKLALGGHPMTGIVIGISQVLPFPGKLARREKVATSFLQETEARASNVEENLELRVRRLYWQLHYAERANSVVSESEKIVNMLTNVVHARFAVGQGAQQDATQAQVAHSTLRSDLEARGQAIASARKALDNAIGRSHDGRLVKTAAFPARRPLLSRKSLLASALANNPRLSVANAQIGVASSALVSARRERLPDFIVGAGYRARKSSRGDSSDGADMISVTVGITLPLWIGRKQNAKVRQESKQLFASRSQLASLRLEIESSVGQVADVVERLDTQLALYDTELLPQASLSVGASIGDYQVGKVGFVSVLQNWRTELQTKLDYEQLLLHRAQGLADLRWLVGAEISRSVP